MSLTIKRQNHRIHPCNASRKNELLSRLAAQYDDKKILIATAGAAEQIIVPEGKNIALVNDETLAQAGDLACDVLISYDLPEKALVYMARIAKSRDYALVLMDAEEQKRLYGIETLLGRTIIQEVITGFEPDFGIAAEKKSKEEAKARRAARDEENARRDERPKRDFKPRLDTDRSKAKRDDRGFRDDKRPSNKDSKPRFIGKDENGKPIFEGKTRDRNHYIDGTPRSDAEKAQRTPYANKPKFFGDKTKSAEGEKKPYADKKSFGDKKPYGDKKAFGDKKPYGDKKSFTDKKTDGKAEDKKSYGDKKSFGDKKPYGDKKYFGDKKPYGDKKSFGDKKPYDSKKSSETPAEPKRPPRRITVKSFKPAEGKE